MPELIPVLSKDRIETLVSGVAAQISGDYKNRELILIAVLKGAFVFLADLMRALTIPARLDFIQVSSYGTGTCSSEKPVLKKSPDIDIRGKDVLVVEDIMDTGLTMAFLIDYLKYLEPKTVKICVFLDKTERRKIHIHPDYACYTVESGFLVGYGLDYDESYRTLPEIYRLTF